MKYLRKFNTEAEVQVFVKPNVVLVEDTGKVLYNVTPPKGVYIQHIDGKLYTTAEWTNRGFAITEANGVAVCDTKASFVIAKASTYVSWSSDTSSLVADVMTTEDSAVAKTDYDGKKNTAAILKTDNGGGAYYCGNYTFPNGQKGYMPALGELSVCNTYIDDINTALSKLGATRFTTGYWQSSTQYNANESWAYGFALGTATHGSKDSEAYCRPFTSL